jgi:hypothetical protein
MFWVFYGTRRFITVLKEPATSSCSGPCEFRPSCFFEVSYTSIIQSTPRSSKLLVFLMFFYRTLWNFPPSRACLMSYPSRAPVTYRIGGTMGSRTDLKALTNWRSPTSTGNRNPAIKLVASRYAVSSFTAYELQVVGPVLIRHVSRRKAMPYLRRLVAKFPPRRPGFEPGSGYMGFVVDKVAPGQVFSEYFGFPCQFAFHLFLHNHHLSSGAGTIGQRVVAVPSGLSLTLCGKYVYI